MTEMKTRWTDKVDLNCPLNEYPRPQLVRNNWQNLNGIYDYAITDNRDSIPDVFDGEIVVPFAPESYLSGVGKHIIPDELLWYRKKFNLNDCFKGKRTIIHFGAVDWRSKVYINGHTVGTHQGGYTPFSFDITDYVNDDENELIVQVYDPTDDNWQSRGKQVHESKGFWYTATSGIWQTVWLEPVNKYYIENIKFTPDIDSSKIKIQIDSNLESASYRAIIKDADNIIFAGKINDSAEIKIKEMKLWSPEDPFLYDVAIALCGDDGKVYDMVSSYFGMRKYSIGLDYQNIPRLYLNNKPYFQNGLLDQGYWSDGGLTAPCDEAMIFDIKAMKELGFNMLRKHIKVEPHRWYYHCDKIGMIVWQDMVCGASKIDMTLVGILPNIFIRSISDDKYKWFGMAEKEARADREREFYDTIDNLYNFPCIGCWVPFNEAWGQFDARRIGEEIHEYDPTRIVDHASGWHDQEGPQLKSIHQYVLPFVMPKNDGRPIVLSEFGGYSRIIENHVWNRDKSFGYKMYKTKASQTKAYKKLYEKQIIPKIKKGLSAVVYTQVSDVEFEVNGMFTYDREILKLDTDTVKELNSRMKY